MRVKEFTPLALLERFLNFNFGATLNRADLKKEPAISLLIQSVYKSRTTRGLKEARRVQEALRKYLRPVVCQSDYEGKNPNLLIDLALTILVEIINQLDLKSEWVVAKGYEEIRLEDNERKEMVFKPLRSNNPFFKGPPWLGPGQKLLKLGTDKWFVYRKTYDETSLEKWLYGLVISTLEDGDLAKLKICQQCEQYFTANNARQTFCETACKDSFNNRRRSKEGYFQKNRKTRRNKLMNQARALSKAGSSIEKITDKTGLSHRRLLEEGVLE